MLGSVLSYVTLRLLGEGADDGDGAMEKGRKWVLDHGGATYITSWGKMWLAVQFLSTILFYSSLYLLLTVYLHLLHTSIFPLLLVFLKNTLTIFY